MLGLDTLDLLIGLVTIYLVFGLACTAIVEAIATLMKLRSTNLEAALAEFFAGEIKPGTPFVKAFYDHPLIQALSKGKDGRPSYIPPEIVAQVVEGLLTGGGDTAMSLAAAVKGLPAMAPAGTVLPGTTPSGAPTEQPGAVEPNRIRGLLEVLVTQAGGNAAAFRQAVGTHYDLAMDRASGWFKRHTQTVGFIAAAILVIFANVDTVELAKSLASNPAARVKMVEVAQQNVTQVESQKPTTPDAVQQAKKDSGDAQQALKAAVSAMQSSGLQLGWTEESRWWAGESNWWQLSKWNWGALLAKVAGLLVSMFAVSLGAPFWFDVLQRFMQVRAAGVTPREKEEGKK